MTFICRTQKDILKKDEFFFKKSPIPPIFFKILSLVLCRRKKVKQFWNDMMVRKQ